MRADSGYVDGNLEIQSHNYKYSNSMIRNWDYEAIKYFSVRTAYDYLVAQLHYDRYDMSGGGSGCRW